MIVFYPDFHTSVYRSYPHSRSNPYLESRTHCICTTPCFFGPFAINFPPLSRRDAIHVATRCGNWRSNIACSNSVVIMAAAGLKSRFTSQFAWSNERLMAISCSCHPLVLRSRRRFPINHPLMRLVVKLASPSRRCVNRLVIRPGLENI